MNEVGLRLAIVVAVVLLSLIIVAVIRRRRVAPVLDRGGFDPGVYLFTSSSCSDCAGARARLQEKLGNSAFIEISWEDDPKTFTQLGIDAVPCTVVVGDDGSASIHRGMPDGVLRGLNP
ncbi:MAG TPA: hypothetical protein VHL55_01140 [Acidimicrobiia bacterium]|jgi:hypothetical protein|nr:hypothetical protein [Acidimicrobiia bacterium]